MFEHILLGIIQGILEWVPVSSEGFVVMLGTYLELPNLIDTALYLHLGTLLAVLVYFRKDVFNLTKAFKNINAKEETPILLRFLLVSTLFSLLLGLPLYYLIKNYIVDGIFILLLVGFGLIMTGALLGQKDFGKRKAKDLCFKDAAFAGLMQGFSIIPGVSRSGVTIFALLGRNFSQETALKTSFLMSIPIVLGANIFLHFSGFEFRPEYLVSVVFAFIFGIVTIHVLLKLSQKISFRHFCWLFGCLAILGFFIGVL